MGEDTLKSIHKMFAVCDLVVHLILFTHDMLDP